MPRKVPCAWKYQGKYCCLCPLENWLIQKGGSFERTRKVYASRTTVIVIFKGRKHKGRRSERFARRCRGWDTIMALLSSSHATSTSAERGPCLQMIR